MNNVYRMLPARIQVESDDGKVVFGRARVRECKLCRALIAPAQGTMVEGQVLVGVRETIEGWGVLNGVEIRWVKDEGDGHTLCGLCQTEGTPGTNREMLTRLKRTGDLRKAAYKLQDEFWKKRVRVG